MNSYFKINRDYRELYLLRKKGADLSEGFYPLGEQPVIRYPDNITLRDFVTYQLYPVLTYQDSFPTMAAQGEEESSLSRWIGKLALRMLNIGLCLVRKMASL
jgi:hypothetical protein